MTYPTPTIPLVMTMPGKPASLKNDRKLLVNEEGKVTGVGQSKTVRSYIQRAKSRFNEQREARNFDLIPMPEMVSVAVFLFLYVAKNSPIPLPNGDDDNCFGTIQESLEHSVLENDRQVRRHQVIWLPAKTKQTEMSLICVWRSGTGHPVDEMLEVSQNLRKTSYGGFIWPSK